MARNIISRLNLAMQRCEQVISHILGGRFPPVALCTVDLGHDNNWSQQLEKTTETRSLKDILDEAFLWAVPKSRRPLEKRWTRKFGCKDHGQVWKLHEPKTNLITCTRCGHYYEANRLCNHCYLRVKGETDEMQDAIVKNLGLNPVEQDVVVLYEGEGQQSKSTEYWKDQRIVELPKPRPAWFHSNLMQSTTQQPSDSTEIKPTEVKTAELA